jgi:hypothetical protein
MKKLSVLGVLLLTACITINIYFSAVAMENADRQSLYQAIANANGHPDWVTQIKSTFAASWVSNAQSGWWYQSSGTWKQK